MSFLGCLGRCLKQTLGWQALIILGGSIVGIIEAIGALIVEYGKWSIVVAELGAGGIAVALGQVVGVVFLAVIVAAVLGCALYCS